MATKKTSIVHATLILLIGTALSKILGFAREILVAYQFGAGNISDAFLLTNGIPNLLFGSIALVVGISYIPYCQTIEGKEKIDFFTSNLLNCITVALIVGCAIVITFPKTVLRIIAGGLNTEAQYYAIVMLRIVVLSIIPIVLAHLFQAYSQINGQFHSTAWFGLITNTIIIVFTLITREETFYLLSLGVVAANCAGMMLSIWSIRSLRFHYSFIINPRDQDIKGIVLLTIPLLIENIAYSMSLLVDRSLASYLDSGTISGLSYAGTLGNIASTMIASSIITAVYPTISRLAAKERESLDFHLALYSKAIVFILCPVSFALVFFAQDVVTIIFNHGAFKGSSLAVVWQSLICYAIGVVPAGLQTYLIRCFYAIKDTKTPVFIQVFALICNIILNIISVKYLKHMGIALSTSISYLIALILLAVLLMKKHKISSVPQITIDAMKGVLCAVVAGAVSFGSIHWGKINIDILWKMVIEMLIFIAIYMGTSWFFQKETIKMSLQLIKSRKKPNLS